MRVFFRLIIIITILIILGELFTRVALTLPLASIPDNELGWKYTPNSTILHTREGHAINSINSMGFNDDDPDPNSEKTRILVLGDSLTEALQVPRAENFTSMAEAIAPCLDFYNAGRSGLSPINYPDVLSRVTKSISSVLAVVVVTVSDMTDIIDSNYKIIRDTAGKRIIGLHYKAKPLPWLRKELDPILRRSALVTFLMSRTKALLMNNNTNETIEAKSGAKFSGTDAKLVKEVLVYLFESMNSEIPIAILYIPRLKYGLNRVASTTKYSYEFELLVKNSASMAKVPYLSSENYLKDSYLEHGQPGNGFANKNILDGHLNSLGHHATAQALIDLVANTGLQCTSKNNSYKIPAHP